MKFDITKHEFTALNHAKVFAECVDDDFITITGEASAQGNSSDSMTLCKDDAIAIAKHFKLNLQDISKCGVIGDDFHTQWGINNASR